MRRTLSKQEQRQIREHALTTVQTGFPLLRRMPIPRSVRAQRWFKESGIEYRLRDYNILAFKWDIFSGKMPPALAILLMEEVRGSFVNRPTLYGASSGNFIKDLAGLARAFNIEKVVAILDKKTPQGKIDHVEASGAIVEFAPAGKTTTDYVYELRDRPNWFLIDQYTHPGSILGHKWTMHHIIREFQRLGEVPSIYGSVLGTTSNMMAAKKDLQPMWPGMKLLGAVSMSPEEKVPGSRSEVDLDDLERIGGFPYKTIIDPDFPLVNDIVRDEVFALNAEYVQDEFIPLGPTGALLQAAKYRRLETHWRDHGDFKALENPQGNVVIGGYCVDTHLPYLGDPAYRKFFRWTD